MSAGMSAGEFLASTEAESTEAEKAAQNRSPGWPGRGFIAAARPPGERSVHNHIVMSSLCKHGKDFPGGAVGVVPNGLARKTIPEHIVPAIKAVTFAGIGVIFLP